MAIVDSQFLIAAYRDVVTPFELRVRGEDGQEIIVEFIKILRLLPRKRLVALANWGDRQILVKTFLGRSAGRYALKERRGVQSIMSSGVRTPHPLWQAELLDGEGQILAFEYLEDSLSLQDHWDGLSEDAERLDILTRTLIILAKLHRQGTAQDDIHLDNFLLSQRRIYTIDGGAISRKSESAMTEKESLENLSWFFAQFFPKFDHLIKVVFPAYEVARNWVRDPNRIVKLHAAVSRNRELRKNHYLRKTLRECTRFVCRSSFKRFMVCERDEYSPEMIMLLADPDKFMAAGKILKQGNSATVALVQVADKLLVIKRYNIKSKWHGLLRAFQKSRAWVSWLNAYRMEFLGIRSLKPVAMLEHRVGPLRNKAYFITEHIEGPDALEYLPTVSEHQDVLEALVSLLQYMWRNRISHGDLKASNLVMAKEGPVIIDLDSTREHNSTKSFTPAFNRDINRFMKNWENQPELASGFERLLAKSPL